MKNITVIFLFIAANIVFSSCSRPSGISIAKRHYTNGYNVDYISGKQSQSGIKTICYKKIEQPISASISTRGNIEQVRSVFADNELENSRKNPTKAKDDKVEGANANKHDLRIVPIMVSSSKMFAENHGIAENINN